MKHVICPVIRIVQHDALTSVVTCNTDDTCPLFNRSRLPNAAKVGQIFPWGVAGLGGGLVGVRRDTYSSVGRGIGPPVIARSTTDAWELGRTALVPVLLPRHSVPTCPRCLARPGSQALAVRRLGLEEYFWQSGAADTRSRLGNHPKKALSSCTPRPGLDGVISLDQSAVSMSFLVRGVHGRKGVSREGESHGDLPPGLLEHLPKTEHGSSRQ